MPLLHMFWRVHIDKCRLVFGSFFSTCTQFWEARELTILVITAYISKSCVKLRDPILLRHPYEQLPTFERRSSVRTLQISLYLVTNQA